MESCNVQSRVSVTALTVSLEKEHPLALPRCLSARSITQECGLDFDETFVEAFLRLIGETADVLGRGLSGISLAKENPYAARDEAAPLGATASMMDMLLARSTCPAIRVRVSSKVAFRYAIFSIAWLVALLVHKNVNLTVILCFVLTIFLLPRSLSRELISLFHELVASPENLAIVVEVR